MTKLLAKSHCTVRRMLRQIFCISHIHKEKNFRLHVSTGIGTVFTTLESQRSNSNSTKPLATERGIRLLRNITSLGITNVNCAQKQNTSQTVHQKCVLYKETEHFPGGTHKAVFTDHKPKFKNETR